MGIEDDEEQSIVSRAAYATKKYFPNHTLREALEKLGSITDVAATGAILQLVDTMRGFTLRNLPNGPGILVIVDYFGPLPLTPRGNAHIIVFTDRFSRCADMYAATEADINRLRHGRHP